MGLFSRFKKNRNPATSDVSPGHNHDREAANPLEEITEADETTSPDGSLSSRTAFGLPVIGMKAEKQPFAAEEIRAAADPEDDSAQELLIEHEREAEERDR
jgi:hypothetical protein